MKARKFKETIFLAVLPVFSAFLMSVAAGDTAPDFTLKNQDGKPVHLADSKGKFVLIYFYPKDETPGCTKEACEFRDQYSKIKKLNAVVFGVSRQDQKSHQEFSSHHKLPFDLLVDEDGAVAKSFGVGSMPVIGLTQRQSILIGPDGKVLRFYSSVDPATHTNEVISDIAKASPPAS